MEKDLTISVSNVSKTFRIPHEKISSLRRAFVNLTAMLRGALWAGVFRSNGYEELKYWGVEKGLAGLREEIWYSLGV